MTPGITAADWTTILTLLDAVAAAERSADGPALLGLEVVEAADDIDATLILRVTEEIRRVKLAARVFGGVTL